MICNELYANISAKLVNVNVWAFFFWYQNLNFQKVIWWVIVLDYSQTFLTALTCSLHYGTCGLAETCRTHNPKVVSSSPTTANVLWTWAISLHLACFVNQKRYLVRCSGNYYNLNADKLCMAWPRSTLKWSEMIMMISW